MPLGAVADEPLGAEPGEVDADRDAVLDRRLGGGDEALPAVQGEEFVVGQAHLAPAQAKLRQARPGAHQDREGAGRDLRVERPLIAGLDGVELAAPGR